MRISLASLLIWTALIPPTAAAIWWYAPSIPKMLLAEVIGGVLVTALVAACAWHQNRES